MKIEIRETKITRAEIDPMDVVRTYPVEWQDWLGQEDQPYDDEDVLDFVKESLYEIGSDIFLDLSHVVTEHDSETEINVQ